MRLSCHARRALTLSFIQDASCEYARRRMSRPTGLLAVLALGPLLPMCAPASSAPAASARSVHSSPATARPSVDQAAGPNASAARQTCRVAQPNDGCATGAPTRPAHQRSRDRIFSTNGTTVFYYQQKTDFDARSLLYATVTDCPLWENVFAWDDHDVYVLEPQSCGGENCGGDYTGYGWGAMGVRKPAAFTWLPGDYGSDGRFVYSRWHDGPLDGARPAYFQVLLCSDEGNAFVVGRDGERFYRDGKLVARTEAFNPAWPGERPR